MLKVSDGQFSRLDQQQSALFLEDLCAFLTVHDPFHARVLGVEGMRAYSAVVLERAQAQGFTQKSTVKLFGQTMMYLGTYFDADPALDWVPSIIEMPLDSVTTQTNRANALREGVLLHLKRISGERGEYLSQFLSCCRTALEQDLTELDKIDATEFIAQSYPEKFADFPDGSFELYTRIASKTCLDAGMTHSGSQLVLLCLMSVYGYGVYSDPLFPWLHNLLQRAPELEAPDATLQRLTRKFINEVIAHLEHSSGRKV